MRFPVRVRLGRPSVSGSNEGQDRGYSSVRVTWFYLISVLVRMELDERMLYTPITVRVTRVASG